MSERMDCPGLLSKMAVGGGATSRLKVSQQLLSQPGYSRVSSSSSNSTPQKYWRNS